ncbi:MAG: hypothetical protein AAF697_15030 [Pseudomonadota bacterium]
MARSIHASRRRVWLALALALTLGLVAYRAVDAFARSAEPTDIAGASPVETRLTNLLETVVGPGQVQVHRAERPDGSQAFLVVINAAAGTADPGDDVLLRLLSSAVFIDTLAGDTVTFDRLTFVASPYGLPDRAALLELFALLAVCALIGGGLAVRESEQSVSPAKERSESRREPGASAGVRHNPQNLIAERISEDPARAARVIRRWLGTRAADT